ncbi:hypothetical protein KAS31_00805 [Candidatus Parcubacteria bacterium]|nr:hypothetical protein [Candidatus Parcubacteria bacterium]
MYKKPTNILLFLLVNFFVFVNYASAVILDDYNKYTPEELIINDIIGNVFIFVLIISAPMFIIGVIRDSKSKKRCKNFSMILFIGVFFSYFLLAFFILMMSTVFFMGYIYNCYPYFAYVVIGVFLFFICVFAKVSAKILKSDFLVVLSLFLIITSMFLAKSIT